ncbi:MAG: MFS transporter [Actinomycetota bacterium]|nr:MFS transporter [Actinomycetota bacterium]
MSRPVLRLMLARLISEAGTFAAIFIGIWGKSSFRLHATPRQMAVSAAVSGLSGIVGGLAAGLLIDRSDPRRVLIGAELFAVPAVLILMIPETIWAFIAVVPFAAFFGGFIVTSMASFAPYLAENETGLQKTNVAIEIASSGAMVFGPAIGAVIAKTWGIDGVFVADAASSVIAVALLARLRLRSIEKRPRARPSAELREGIRYAATNRGVRLYIVSGAAIWFSYGAFAALEVLFYRDVLHSGPGLLGWVLSTFGAGLACGALLLNRLPVKSISARTLLLLMLVLSAGEITYVATSNLAIVYVGNVVWGVAMGAAFPMVRTLVQRETPDRLVGRVMGSSVTLNRGAQMIPLTFVGALAVAFGVQKVLTAAGVVLAVLSATGLLEARAVDRTRRTIVQKPQPDPAIAEAATRGLL